VVWIGDMQYRRTAPEILRGDLELAAE
jgi:hypothetical protein